MSQLKRPNIAGFKNFFSAASVENRQKSENNRIFVPINKKKDAKKPGKKSRNCLPLDQRLEIVRLRENGSTFAQIARDKKMNESSIRTIWKNKDDIERQGIQTAKFDAKTNCLEKIYSQIRNGAAFAHLG